MKPEIRRSLRNALIVALIVWFLSWFFFGSNVAPTKEDTILLSLACLHGVVVFCTGLILSKLNRQPEEPKPGAPKPETPKPESEAPKE